MTELETLFQMLTARFCVINIFIFTLILRKSSSRYMKEDKLVLNPVELIDLIIEEQRQADSTTAACSNLKYMDFNVYTETTTETSKEENATVKHKVWSRWSKWSRCAALFRGGDGGPGAVWRRRVCVAGPCAPGEREEQRRPCAAAEPQAYTDSTTFDPVPQDDLNDLIE